MIQHLRRRQLEKVWGRSGLDPRFCSDPDRRVGELWFESEGGEALEVLAKYLFTTERLSIQVHPDERMAHARGLPHGKDECWIVLEALPGAEVGIGTVRPIEPDALLASAEDGSIEELIDWRPARRGQFIYNPAGTVHALGADLTILEIQQPFDVTYRLFDYGRGRDLHLAESREVVVPRPHRHDADGDIDLRSSKVLVDGPWFGVAWCFGRAPSLPEGVQDLQLLPIDAPVSVGGSTVEPGHGAIIDDAAEITSSGAFVLAWATPPGRSGG